MVKSAKKPAASVVLIVGAMILLACLPDFCLAAVERSSRSLPSAEEIAKLPPDGGPDFNRLIHEKSPYLLQHAANPVHWYPWGEEAFARAVRENKPIFLSVGYSTCHWCHVMAHESFEHPEVAALLNKYFICIKVDREERPDIDEIYMNATQFVTGRGGWPNSVWLTPEGKPWFAGTYFPREDRPGFPGFITILNRLSETWSTRRDEVETQANILAGAIRQMASGPAPETSERFSRDIVTDAIDELRASFDSRNGGFGGVPKFPPHTAFNLLFYEYRRTEDDSLLSMATQTLDAMSRGGIRDHVGVGFHRYSTDSKWLVPHFEKMLYDNAQLARAYVDGYILTGNEDYRRVAEEVYEWVLREMADESGAFYSAIDADSEGEEGKFYLWRGEEIVDVLGKKSGGLFSRVYGIKEGDDFGGGAAGEMGGGNIPHLTRGLEDIAKDEGIPLAELVSRLSDARRKLLVRRETRVHPHLDDKSLAGWNGLMIGSLAYGGRHLDQPRYTAAAEKTAEFILTTMMKDGKLLHTYRDGEARLPGYLDDYAFLADGLLELHETTREEVWLERARALSDTLLAEFRDERRGGFFFTSSDHEDLLARSKSPYDRAMPSGNAVAARVLVRLSRSAEDDRYADASRKSFDAFLGPMQRAPAGTAALVLAAAMYFDGIPAVTIARHDRDAGRAAGETKADAIARKAPVTAEAFVSRVSVAPGETFHIAVRLTIEEGWHINSHEPLQEQLVPTSIAIEETSRFILGEIPYEKGSTVDLAFSPEPLSVYDGSVIIDVPLSVPKDMEPGENAVDLLVRFQACDDTACLAPEVLTLPIKVEIEPDARSTALRHRDIFESIDLAASIDSAQASSKGFWEMLKDFDTEAFIERYGYLPAFLAVYLLGLGLTLTPCVYPIIPITVGYFATQADGRWTRRLALASIFGLGVAMSYAAAGTIAAVSGSVFGAALHSPWVLTVLAALCVAMGLNAFGLYELRLPAWLTRLSGGGSRAGAAGAAVMGLTMGIAGASCLAAFIVSLLAFVAERGNPALGFVLFLTLGLGFATPFVALAVFSGLLHKLPKSGAWLVYSKKVMGTLLFGAALYFLRTVIPGSIFGPLVFVCLAAAGLYFAFFERTPVSTRAFRAVRLSLGIAFVALALWWSVPDSGATSGGRIDWRPYSEEALEQARADGRPVVIDFFADWCVACKELDRVSFSDMRVAGASRGFVMLRADMTETNTLKASALTYRYKIFGFPTIVFLGPDGQEREELRIMQFVPADVVLDRFGKLSDSTDKQPSGESTS